MKSIRPSRPSPALVISVIALIMATAGVGVAASRLPANSVGTRELKNHAVIASKVKHHSLLAVDFKAGQLPAGEQGPTGNTGPTGDTGMQGAPGISGYVQVDAHSALDTTTPKSATALCPTGMKVIGGGVAVPGAITVAISNSVPLADGTGWTATAYTTASQIPDWSVDARAICADVAP
jgi:hypothetical protein